MVAEHAKRPFVVGYRISPDEPTENGLRFSDTLLLVDRLIDAGVEYLHVSLADALHATAIDDPDGPTIVQALTERLPGGFLSSRPARSGQQHRPSARSRQAFRSWRWDRDW